MNVRAAMSKKQKKIVDTYRRWRAQGLWQRVVSSVLVCGMIVLIIGWAVVTPVKNRIDYAVSAKRCKQAPVVIISELQLFSANQILVFSPRHPDYFEYKYGRMNLFQFLPGDTVEGYYCSVEEAIINGYDTTDTDNFASANEAMSTYITASNKLRFKYYIPSSLPDGFTIDMGSTEFYTKSFLVELSQSTRTSEEDGIAFTCNDLGYGELQGTYKNGQLEDLTGAADDYTIVGEGLAGRPIYYDSDDYTQDWKVILPGAYCSLIDNQHRLTMQTGTALISSLHEMTPEELNLYKKKATL